MSKACVVGLGVGVLTAVSIGAMVVGALLAAGADDVDEPPPPHAVRKTKENKLKGKIYFIRKESIQE
jgi:hypothetical protein